MDTAGAYGDELEHSLEEDGGKGGGVNKKSLEDRKRQKRNGDVVADFVINNSAGLFQCPLIIFENNLLLYLLKRY